METMTVRLEAFEGPFDLLYHLIEKNQIDIYNIPIAQLTDQYLDFIHRAPEPSMESMSQFLVMASTLLEIKSKLLLPKPPSQPEEEEEDPREALVAKLLEYKKYKEITQTLQKCEEESALMLYRKDQARPVPWEIPQAPAIEEVLEGVTMEDIRKAFREVLRRREGKIDKVRSGFSRVRKDIFTIEEKMQTIQDLLAVYPKVSFSSIFQSDVTKLEVVVTFLALLELIKTKKALLEQSGLFGEIIVKRPVGCDTIEAV